MNVHIKIWKSSLATEVYRITRNGRSDVCKKKNGSSYSCVGIIFLYCCPV